MAEPTQYHIDPDKEEELVAKLEGERKIKIGTLPYYIVSILAFSWSLFQIYVAYFPVNTILVRSIHLSFAIFLGFMIYGALKDAKFREKVFLYDYILAFIGSIGALYIFLNYEALAYRQGAYITLDIVAAVVTTVILLEVSRRVLGPALLMVALLFLAYDYFGPYMPDLIAHKGASLHKLSGQMFLTTEGIFGIALGVSADFIFLFVLFGALLERAGAGEYFINLAYALLGKYRGGPAKASVAASGMTGIISGSSTANVVTTGNFTIPLMKKLGFTGEKAAAVEVAASTNGQLMPPIMGAAAFIIAEFLGLPFTQVIIAAAVPAVVSYIALFYIIHLESLKLGLQGEDPAKLPNKLKVFLSGIHYLIPVFYLMYLLMVEQKSPTYSGLFAILLLMFLMIIQHPIKKVMNKEKIDLNSTIEGFVDIFHGMVMGARNMIPVAIATAVAGIVVGSVTLTGIGLVMTEVIEAIAGNNILLILILVAIMSLVLGMGLPTTANYIVVSSLTIPVILELSAANGFIIPLIALHLFVFYFGILADDTPPVGIAAYAGAGIAKSDPLKTGVQGFIYDMRTAILPFMFFFNPSLVLVEAGNPDNFFSEFMITEWMRDPSGWVWITDPFQIVTIFITAIIGMFAFANATQGYFVVKSNILERLLFLVIVPFMFLPNIMTPTLGLPNEYVSYAIGIGIYGLIYLLQKRREDIYLKSHSETEII